MKTLLAIFAATALTVAPAVLEGQYSNRWGSRADLSVAGKQLHEFPRTVGAWQNVEDERPLSDAVCRELGLTEHFHRQYVHSTTGKQVNVLLMVGPPGRLVRHPPDVCYANRANQQLGEVESLEHSGTSARHQFKLLSFQRTSQPVPSNFRVAYAFHDGESSWQTPSSPRMEYGAAPVLYKLQVLSETKEGKESETIDAYLEEFIEAFSVVLLNENAESDQAE